MQPPRSISQSLGGSMVESEMSKAWRRPPQSPWIQMSSTITGDAQVGPESSTRHRSSPLKRSRPRTSPLSVGTIRRSSWRPGVAQIPESSRGRCSTPRAAPLGILGRVELDDLTDLTAPGIAALVFDAGVDHSLVVDDERGVDVVPGPVPEHLGGFATVGEVGDVPALDEATAVGEVDDVARDGDRTLDRHIATDVSQEFVVPAGRVEHSSGSTVTRPSGS